MRTLLISSRSLALAALLALLGTTVWFAADGAPSAHAHAVQLSSSPAPNEQLAEPPETISIQFSEPLEPAVTSVQLWNTTPEQLDLGVPEYPTQDSLVVAVPQELESGIYTVIWRNLSTVDGHTWAGSFTFVVLGPNGEAPTDVVPASLQDLAQPPSNTPSTLDTTARWIVLLGTAIMLGGTAYVMFVVLPASRVLADESRRALRNLSTTILVVTSAIAVFLVLQGSLIELLVQADRLGGVETVDNLLTDTRFGKYLIARQGLLLVTLISVFFAWRAEKGRLFVPALSAVLVGSFGVLFTRSMVSHAAGADGAFWKVGADLLHLLTAALWVGALIHIGLAMPRWLDELRGVPRTLFAAESFRRFSVLAAVSVVVLMVSGVLSAFSQFATFGQLFDTAYGWSLVGKMAVMLPLLAVAGLNAFILQPRVIAAGAELSGAATDGGAPASDATATGPIANLQRLLVNTVRLEAVLAIMVLVAVGVLTQLEPARAEAEVEAANPDLVFNEGTGDDINERGYFLEATQLGGLVISIAVDPAEVGINNFEIGLGSEFGDVGEILLVRLDIDHADGTVPRSTLELPLAGSAKFAAEGSNLTRTGLWDITATVRRRGEDDVIANFTVPVEEAGTRAAAEEAAAGSSIWDWPFEGGQAVGAVLALFTGAAGLVLVGAWQVRALRKSRLT